MNKRSVPIVIISCILALAGLAGYLAPEPGEANPTRLLMENAGGRVVFTHSAHSTPGGAYGDSSCSDCHHDLHIAPAAIKDAATPKVLACASCHGTADQPDFVQKHQELYRAKGGEQTCARCHHIRFEGYSDKWNHKDHWDYVGDCATCHHESRLEYKTGKFMNVKPQKCANCHTDKPNPMTTVTRKDAGHQRCQSCHSDFFDEGAKGCATCHGAIPSAGSSQGKENPDPRTLVACATCHGPVSGGMDAFHGNCMSCHDKVGKGPGKEAPCAQCHTP